MIERSPASRFYRWATHRRVAGASALAIISGWTLVLFAQGEIVHEALQSPPIAFGSGILVLMGVAGGVSRWVAKPAAREVLAEHLKDDTKAHPTLVPRSEWSSEQAKLNETILNLRLDLRGLISELRRGGGVSLNDTQEKN